MGIFLLMLVGAVFMRNDNEMKALGKEIKEAITTVYTDARQAGVLKILLLAFGLVIAEVLAVSVLKKD